VALLKAGAEADKKDNEGHTALELAPDAQVFSNPTHHKKRGKRTRADI